MEIRVEHLWFSYKQAVDEHPVLRDVNLCLESGQCVALIGPSGSGKSTLAQHLNGLLQPDSGCIRIDGRLINSAPSALKALRKRVGLVFQFPEVQIFEQSVFDEVAFAARQWGVLGAEIASLVNQALETVGLNPENLMARNPFKLSGGEARLVSIASLLVVDPDWLILDEPTLGLDANHRRCIETLIRQRSRRSRGVLLITHDLELVLSLCPRSLILDRGSLKYDGPTRELFLNHDARTEFHLIEPEVIQLWKLLEPNFAELPSAATGFPQPEVGALQLWISGLSLVDRNQIADALRRHLAGKNVNGGSV